MPANVSENIRPMVIAGLAKLVGAGEEVRSADVGGDDRRGEVSTPGSREGEEDEDQSRSREDLREQVTGRGAVGGAPQHRR